MAEVKALACELPAEKGVALSRWSSAELARAAIKRGIVATIAAVTIWRWLREDAIRRWNYRSWIFPRDPKFAEKAGRILAGRPEYVRGDKQSLYPGMTRLTESSLLNIKNKSFQVTAQLVVPEGGARGTIIAQGGSFGGSG